jgi:eukaryotic-like serine/threonine-protein kinase
LTARTDEPLFGDDDWRQLRALMDHLDNLPTEAQAAELAQLGATNPARASAARALLAQSSPGASAQLHDVLQRVVPPADAEMPAQVGPFRLRERIGAGGMGVVYLAERSGADFTQRVALKLLDGGAARMSRLAARERRILATLTHPNITAFVDGGAENGRAWLAMEYVDGEPLLVYCARLGLDLSERVQLFDQVCAAVAYAHTQLIVHRDLKPSNVLVNNDGKVKLLDFGIALVLDASDEQTPATRVFTPEYASPEQLRGDRVTTVTDVYALGLVLYELATGKRLPTLERAGNDAEWTTAELTRHATQADPGAHPADARTLARQLRGDLGTILARALKNHPTERYASVQAFADDLRRYLAHRPIRARADSRAYRLRKYARRHRVGVGIGALLALVVIAGIGGVIWEAHVAQREAARAISVKNFLTGLFDDTRNTRAGIEVRKASAMDILNSGAERLKTELGDQPEVRDEIYQMLVEIFDSSGDAERSFALAHARVAAAEAAYGADDARVAPALIMLAGVSMNHEKLDDAKPLLARSEALLDRARDHDSLDRARLWTWQGNLQRLESGKDAKFEGNRLIDAVDLLRREHPREDDREVALMMYTQLAVTSGHLPEAERAAAEMRENAIAKYGANTVYVAQAEFVQSRILLRENKFAEALAQAQAAVEGFAKFEGDAHPDLLYAQFVELNALLGLKRTDEARALFSSADTVRREKLPDDPRLAKAYADIAAKLGL